MNSNISFIAGRGPLPIFAGAKPHSEKFTFNLPHSTEIRKFSLLIAKFFHVPADPFLLCNNIVTYSKTFSREKRAKFCIFFTHISHQIYATLKPVLTLPRSASTAPPPPRQTHPAPLPPAPASSYRRRRSSKGRSDPSSSRRLKTVCISPRCPAPLPESCC